MTSAPSPADGCPDCRRDHDHCHEAVVVHVDEEVECLDRACRSTIEGHTLLVRCTDVDDGCLCL